MYPKNTIHMYDILTNKKSSACICNDDTQNKGSYGAATSTFVTGSQNYIIYNQLSYFFHLCNQL